MKKIKNYKREKWRGGGSSIFQQIQERRSKWSVTPGGKRAFGVRRWESRLLLRLMLTGNWDNTEYQTPVPLLTLLFLLLFLYLSFLCWDPNYTKEPQTTLTVLISILNKPEILASVLTNLIPFLIKILNQAFLRMQIVAMCSMRSYICHTSAVLYWKLNTISEPSFADIRALFVGHF